MLDHSCECSLLQHDLPDLLCLLCIQEVVAVLPLLFLVEFLEVEFVAVI